MSLKAIVQKLEEIYPNKKQKEINEFTKNVFQVARELVEEKNRLKVPYFGIFNKKSRAARTIKVPKSEMKVSVPKQKTVTFKPSKDWKEEMNK